VKSSEYPYTSKHLAAEFGVEVETMRRRLRELGLGLDFGGRAGYRYSEADRASLIESLRPVEAVTRRRRRSA
jgi:hypothetical protein